ncbi:MAG: hypothetical protein GT601_05820 [Acidaminobacter sp.]|uniref:hypothetical protein n=1 Tax=Acidaminobacter sp. TaxID=1872102 RepID=UPI0013859A2D|nr:hypothetical protein [Acidaminobacter sp.]MZQ97173.1 hypothetical protein [Acidaminobacter sp.]
MKVSTLIEFLEDMPGKAEVYFEACVPTHLNNLEIQLLTINCIECNITASEDCVNKTVKLQTHQLISTDFDLEEMGDFE